MEPTDATAVFDKDVGTWDADVLVRFPGGESRSRGTMRARMMAGRWLLADFSTETGDFHGHGVYGWDPQRGAYVGTWVDSMRTFLAVGEGHWDAAARTMTFRYEFDLPGRGRVTQRDVTETRSPDEQVFRSYVSMGGAPETEMMLV